MATDPVNRLLNATGKQPRSSRGNKPQSNPRKRYYDPTTRTVKDAAIPSTVGKGGKTPTTAQRQRARVGHLRGAVQTNKDALAALRARAKSGGPDAKRKARMAQQSVIDRIKAQAAQRDRDHAKAKKMGWTDKDLEPRTPAARAVASATTPRGTDSSGTGSGTGSSGSGGSTSTSGGGGSTPAATPTGGKSTPRMGAAIRNARAKREELTGISISAKELKTFMARYQKSHKGTNLSRENAVLLARLIKKRGGEAAITYGFAKRPPGTPGLRGLPASDTDS